MKKEHVVFLLMVIIGTLITCQKLEIEPVTKVNTVSAISKLNSMQVQGKIVELSSKSHNEKGFCYARNPFPTVDDSTVVSGKGNVGVFLTDISGLASGTTYYVRAYCKEGNSYVYGESVETKTVTAEDIITDIDGNKYITVKIGDQVWMRENLAVQHYRNGDPIPNIGWNEGWSAATEGVFCNYKNISSYSDIYGSLYNYYTTIDGRYLCPTGWRVPTEDDWSLLIEYLGGESIAGGKMKEIGTIHWNSPNKEATNESLFTGLPGGYRDANGEFSDMGVYGKWWSSSVDTSYRYLSYNDASLPYENNNRTFGASIRCVKGEGKVLPIVTTSTINIFTTSATSGGNITSDGGAVVTARGVCWSISQNPTIANSHTIDGGGVGTFSSNISSLNSLTHYYVRAYATNSVGTAYGEQIDFTSN